MSQAFNFVSDGIVKPVYHDIIKPIAQLPSEALHTVDKGVSIFENPILPLALGGVALAIFLRR